MPVALCVAVAAAVTQSAVAGDGVLIADSQAEFSSTQGADGWYYGFYATEGDPDSFTELCCYDPAGGLSWWERSAAQPPWNLVWAGGQHPDETWTARRWVAEVTGLVRIDITSDHWEGVTGARTVRVLNDGVLVYERVFTEGVGGIVTDTVFAATVSGGSVDFTVSSDGDVTDDATLLRAEIYRIAVFPPTVDDPPVVEVDADEGTCFSSLVPAAPAATPACVGGTTEVSGVRSDGLAITDPYPVGITRIDWTIQEIDCPNDALVFEQWILVRAAGCPDCSGKRPAGECGVQNVTRDTSFLTIQAALDAADDGDEIVVGPGTYDETIDLLGKQVTLRSSDGPAATIIDIAGMAASVVTCATGEGPGTVVDGFTITGSTQPDDGGGIYVQAAGPTITNCVVTGNTAGRNGAGMYVTGDTAPTVFGCTFAGNTAGLHGGGVHSGSITITNCVLDANAALRGAGFYTLQGLQTQVTSCLFTNNAGAEGTAIWIGVFDAAADVAITNCTFSGNTGGLGSGIYILSACDVSIHVANCVLWEQVVIDSSCGTSNVFEHNNGVFPSGVNNINADPMFVDAARNNYRLQAGSPCIDAGTNAPLPPGSEDLDGNPRFADDPCVADSGAGVAPLADIGVYEFQGSTCDIDGDGAVGIQDFLTLLAEWGPCPVPPEPCPADIDGDGQVGINDLLQLLANWG